MLFWLDAEQTSLVQFETLFLPCKMFWIQFYFPLSSGVKQLAQYCETGGAVDSMKGFYYKLFNSV